jgi:hypothetical protein
MMLKPDFYAEACGFALEDLSSHYGWHVQVEDRPKIVEMVARLAPSIKGHVFYEKMSGPRRRKMYKLERIQAMDALERALELALANYGYTDRPYGKFIAKQNAN